MGRFRAIANLLMGSAMCVMVAFVAGCGDSQQGDEFEIFAYDNYMAQGEYRQDHVRAQVLKELGYDGMGDSGVKDLVETIEIFEEAGLKIYSTYLCLFLDGEEKYDAKLLETIGKLKGKDTVLWMFVSSRKYELASAEGDAVAIKAIREIADAADESGLKVVLYPHADTYAETLADCVRLAKKTNRRNVGGSFNLCHWLKVQGDVDYREALKESLPYLFMVSTNGADLGDTQEMGWDRLIRPLGRGQFDNYALIKYLKEIGYDGPIGLQGYGIKGDAKLNLAASMKAWREINKN